MQTLDDLIQIYFQNRRNDKGRLTIVSRINKIHNISREYRDYILQKAKVDNNYLVRKVVLREIEKITAHDI